MSIKKVDKKKFWIEYRIDLLNDMKMLGELYNRALEKDVDIAPEEIECSIKQLAEYSLNAKKIINEC